MAEKIIALQPIHAYQAPQWLVETAGRPVPGNLVASYLSAAQVEIIDRHVAGWGDANAIVRISRDDPFDRRQGDFLAVVRDA